MICDRIDHSAPYDRISAGLARAFAALRDGSFAQAEPGRYDLDGDRVFALVQHYTTRPVDQCNLESHRRYIDVQAVLAGQEAMGVAPVEPLAVKRAYEDANDYALYDLPAAMTWLRLGAGDFAVFFPHDAHLPCSQAGGPSEVKKVVIKVLAE